MRASILLFCLLLCFTIIGQDTWRLGILPELTIGHKVSEDWKVSFQVESMQASHEGSWLEDLEPRYTYVRTDLTGVITRRLGPLHKAGFGYMYRMTEGDMIHRAIQQYAWVRRSAAYRLGHRLRSDQTWRDGRPPVYRLRYRVAADIPLAGQTLDTGELYMVPSVEQLGILVRSEGDGETRFMWRLGILANKGMKFEMGIDHRWNGYIQEDVSHQTWWMMNAFIDL